MRSLRAVFAAALAAAAPAALLAQATSPTSPLLRVHTDRRAWVEPFAQQFGLQLPDAALAAGERLEVTLPRAGTAALRRTTEAAPANSMTVEVHTAAWLQQEASALAAFVRQVRPRAEGFAKLAGLRPPVARRVFDQILEVVQSVDLVRATVTQVGAGRAYDVSLELVPRPDTDLAAWLANLRPGPREAPRLRWPDEVVHLGVALEPTHLAAVVEPFLAAAAGLGSLDDVQQAANEADLRALLPTLDGTFGLSLQRGRLGTAFGLRDAKAYVHLATLPERLRRQQTELERQRIDAEFTPAAATHRGVPLLRSRVSGDRPLPGLADAEGDLVAFGGLVGDLWLQIGGGEDPQQAMQRAIDDALDRGLRGAGPSRPTGGDAAWCRCEVDLVRLTELVAAEAGSEAFGNGAPRRLQLALSAAPGALRAELRLR